MTSEVKIKQVLLGGVIYDIEWSDEWAKVNTAEGEIYGFGATPYEAVLDLQKAYKDLCDFANDCQSDWWKATYR